MAEQLAKKNHPTDSLTDAYEQWSQGGWGSILTGKLFKPPPSHTNWT